MKTCSFLATCFHRGEGGAWWAVLGKEWAASQAGGWDRVNAGWAMRGQSLGPGSGTQHSCAADELVGLPAAEAWEEPIPWTQHEPCASTYGGTVTSK